MASIDSSMIINKIITSSSSSPSRSPSLSPCLMSSPKSVSLKGGSTMFGRGVGMTSSSSKGLIQRRRLKMKSQVFDVTMGLIGKAHRWWEKGIQTNMKEIASAQDFVDSLNNAGDRLVIVDFFSPGCGGCKALHPKICQIAEQNPDVQFLQVNYEKHKSMCYSLNVHVLPFFRFYRGAHGRLCSFSCTNATIKKFRDALAKHTTDRCSIGPIKGLEESELLALAANKDLSFTYSPKLPSELPPVLEEIPKTVHTSVHANLDHLLHSSMNNTKESEEKTLIASGR